MDMTEPSIWRLRKDGNNILPDACEPAQIRVYPKRSFLTALYEPWLNFKKGPRGPFSFFYAIQKDAGFDYHHKT